MNEYDQRQYILMLQKIRDYRSASLSLFGLINALEALLNVLEEKDITWEADYRTSWWDLEQVYAFALYKEKLS